MATGKSSCAMAFLVAVNLLFAMVSATSLKNVACSTPPGTPAPGTPTPSTAGGKCPVDALKLGVCAKVADGLINAKVGKPPKEPCCPLIEGLVDLEAAVCLCTVIKANVLGLKLNLPISLSLVLNYCGKKVPSGFQCP